ncbi:MAG: hypothetical protein KJ048_11640 [Dehalococcoidia bacterium]|nr:hypothetical protein [Dehalococcoidia bacterium]
MLTVGRRIPVAGAAGGKFDHAACDELSGLVFIAQTSNGCVAVLDPVRCVQLETLPDHAGAAGVVAAHGQVAVTNRDEGTLSVIDGRSLREVQRVAIGARPNGVALGSDGIAVVGDLGDDSRTPALVWCHLRSGSRKLLELPGPPKWLVMDPVRSIAYCAISSPSGVLVLDALKCEVLASWPLPAADAHGVDLDTAGGRLWVACDGGELVSVSTRDGSVLASWPLPGVPDATFFNPDSGRVHVAIGEPGTIATVDPAQPDQVHLTPTGPGAKTTALVRPGQLFAFRPQTGDALELIEPATTPGRQA